MCTKFRVVAQEAPWFRVGNLECQEHEVLNWLLDI
jgi:hypothetical protein